MEDEVGVVRSLSANLIVLMDPTIVLSPMSQSAPNGGFVTLSVQVTNVATAPIGYRWRMGSQTMGSNNLTRYYDFWTVPVGPNVSDGAFLARCAPRKRIAPPAAATPRPAAPSAVFDSFDTSPDVNSPPLVCRKP